MNSKNIYTVSALRDRPAMYLGSLDHRLDRLHAFFAGVSWGMMMAKMGTGKEFKKVVEFEFWLGQKLGGVKSRTLAYGFLLEESGGDEEVAFEKFFEYWEEWRGLHGE